MEWNRKESREKKGKRESLNESILI